MPGYVRARRHRISFDETDASLIDDNITDTDGDMNSDEDITGDGGSEVEDEDLHYYFQRHRVPSTSGVQGVRRGQPPNDADDIQALSHILGEYNSDVKGQPPNDADDIQGQPPNDADDIQALSHMLGEYNSDVKGQPPNDADDIQALPHMLGEYNNDVKGQHYPNDADDIQAALPHTLMEYKDDVKGKENAPLHLFNVNVTNFVSIKLSGKTNYRKWKGQIECLLAIHDLLNHINGKMVPLPPEKKSSDKIVKRWILCSLSQPLVFSVLSLKTALDVWKELKDRYSKFVTRLSDAQNKNRMKYVPLYRAILDNDWITAERYLRYESHIWNAKLNDNGHTSLHLAVGKCTSIYFQKKVLDKIKKNIKHYNDIVQRKQKYHEDLVNTIGSNIEKITTDESKGMDQNVVYNIAKIITHNLDTIIAEMKDNNIAEEGAQDIAQNIGNIITETVANYAAQYTAINIANDIDTDMESFYRETNIDQTLANTIANNIPTNVAPDRWKEIAKNVAKNIVRNINRIITKNATNNISNNMPKERAQKYLYDLVSNDQSNVLHHAAYVGNTDAAQELVKAEPLLLFKVNNKDYLPIHLAISAPHKEAFRFLLTASKKNIDLSREHGCPNPFEDIQGTMLLHGVINAGLMEVAYELIKEYPAMAKANLVGDVEPALTTIANKFHLYYSQPNKSRAFDQVVAKELQKLNVRQEDQDGRNDIEAQHGGTFVNKCMSCFQPISKYFGSEITMENSDGVNGGQGNLTPGNAMLLTDPVLDEVKDFPEKEVMDNKPLLLLRSICNQVRKLDTLSEMREHYIEAATLVVKHDIPEALEEIARHFPEAIWVMHDGYHLIELAILERSKRVYDFLSRRVIDNKFFLKTHYNKDGNNLLHLAANLAPIGKLNMVPGAALQMQRELQWFEEVKKFVLPKHREAKNKEHETPIMVFRRKHKDLRNEGEAWLKNTAHSYIITAILMVAITFAAVLTAPGGTNDSGFAKFGDKPSFTIFVISDSISMLTSTASLLMFLSILTSRYAENDFLNKLPCKLICGLLMLSISAASMLVAFCAALNLVYGHGHGHAWVLILVATSACVTIASFVLLQFSLLKETILNMWYWNRS